MNLEWKVMQLAIDMSYHQIQEEKWQHYTGEKGTDYPLVQG